jgi:peptidoglycan/LPS O-acetylase OafA/YrhL
LRKDIQFLRAFAVSAVVFYHLWPNLLTGGYVGVDIFFVISGFLITSHLFKEVARDGRIRFTDFYARRARRILPSAVLVLVLTLIGTLIWTPLAEWQTAFRQILASTLFYENWQLAIDQVDYLTAGSPPAAVQNYWSLAVEEQFYLFWPLLIWLSFIFFSRKLTSPSRGLIWVFAVVGVLSLGFSIFYTNLDPVPAFFVTTTRVWEFVAGAVIALLPAAVLSRRWVSLGAAILGWALLALSIFIYKPDTPFPGWAALVPVLGTALVIFANVDALKLKGFPALVDKPVLFVAEISFALYLFHWPILIFAEQALGHSLGLKSKVAVIVLTVACSIFATFVVEKAIRFGPFSKKMTSSLQLGVALACIIALAVGTFSALRTTERFDETAIAQKAVTGNELCLGAAVRIENASCPTTTDALTPDPALAFKDKPEVTTGSRCGAGEDVTVLFNCSFANPKSSVRVALIGDSHAMAIFPAIEVLATQQDWSLTTYLRAKCPFVLNDFPGSTPRAINCNNWNQDLASELASTKPFDYIFVTSNHSNNRWDDIPNPENWYAETWAPITARGTKVIVVRDVPGGFGDAINCLVRQPSSTDSCSIDKEQGLGLDPLILAAKKTPNAYLVDLTKYFCDDSRCFAAIGGVVAYRDGHHLTNTFAKTLARPLKLELELEGIALR